MCVCVYTCVCPDPATKLEQVPPSPGPPCSIRQCHQQEEKCYFIGDDKMTNRIYYFPVGVPRRVLYHFP